MIRNITSEGLLQVISGSMAGICEQSGAYQWRTEADLLVRHHVKQHGGEYAKLHIPNDIVTLLDFWQNERLRLNTDFPLQETVQKGDEKATSRTNP